MGTNDVFFSQHPVQNLLARLDDLSPIHILSRESGPSGTILSSTSASTGDSDVWIFGLHYLMMWTRLPQHPRGLSLSERDRQRPDNRSMTCASNAQVASHGTKSTRYICDWVSTAARDPSCEGQEAETDGRYAGTLQVMIYLGNTLMVLLIITAPYFKHYTGGAQRCSLLTMEAIL
ncbi:hypothetical protein F5888DRAFT_321774 [Russula emetica]|nr:hypothetical protein F5888DRAFT_321774 [Russula emetica]